MHTIEPRQSRAKYGRPRIDIDKGSEKQDLAEVILARDVACRSNPLAELPHKMLDKMSNDPHSDGSRVPSDI